LKFRRHANARPTIRVGRFSPTATITTSEAKEYEMQKSIVHKQFVLATMHP
jgi:hypothetical protein